MNKLAFLVFIISMAFLSCDGRYRAHLSNAEVLKENKLLSSFSEKLKFTPKQSINIETDTILSNNFQVKLKYYSLETNSIVKTYKTKNGSLINHTFKNFEAQIQILNKNNIISQNLIDKHLFYQFETISYWENAIMQHPWIDYNNSKKNSVSIIVSFNIPNTINYKDFSLTINENGNIKIRQIDLIPNII